MDLTNRQVYYDKEERKELRERDRERERERERESFSATQHPISATTYVDMFICIAKLGLHIIYASVWAIPTYRVYPLYDDAIPLL